MSIRPLVDQAGTAKDPQWCPEWFALVPAASSPYLLTWTFMVEHGGPQLIATETLSAIHGVGGAAGKAAKELVLWSNQSSWPVGAEPVARFGRERALAHSGSATTLWSQAGNDDIVGVALGAGTGPLPSNKPKTIPAGGREFVCLHAPADGGSLGALEVGSDGELQLVEIGLSGRIDTKLRLGSQPSAKQLYRPEGGDGSPVCSFSRASGKLTALVADIDANALPFAKVRSLSLLAIDTRAPKVPTLPLAQLRFPFGKAAAGQTWRPIGAGLGWSG